MAATGPNGGEAGLNAPGDGAQAGVISVDIIQLDEKWEMIIIMQLERVMLTLV